MKVLLLADHSSIHTKRWAIALANLGVDVCVFSLSNKPQDLNDYPAHIEVYNGQINQGIFLKSQSILTKLSYLKLLPRLKKLIKTFKPDIVHAHYATSYGLLGVLSKKTKLFITVWGSDVLLFPKRGFLHKKLIKTILEKADVVTSSSKFMADEVNQWSRCEIKVIPFGIDTELFKLQPNKKMANDFVIGTVKSLEVVYGIDCLIKSFAVLCKKVTSKKLKLVIVGDGSQYKALRELSERLSVLDKIEFLGKVPNTELPAIYSRFNLTCFFSRSESFGVSIIESASCEVPSVVSNVGGLPEVVINEKTGWVLKAFETEKIADELLSIINSENLEKVGREARLNVLKKYRFELNTNEMYELYETHISQ